MNEITDFYDLSKKGTLIVSTYRSGTHFLYDNLVEHLQTKNIGLTLFNEVGDLEFLQSSGSNYKIAILNSVGPKISLVKEQCLLNDWHVVTLTRNDKLLHWMSYYVWQQFNTEQQRVNNSNLPHHGGTRDKYKHISPVTIDTSVIEQWLLEQYLVHLFKGSIVIDYADLSTVSGTEFIWNPNDYGLSVEDLFVNHVEVKNLLQKYNI